MQINAILKTKKNKVATSVTVASEVLEAVDLLVPPKERSRFFEATIRRELRRRLRQARTQHDLEILNANAAKLDRETDDLLDIQADPFA